jgi:hypothetical protein
MPNNFDHEKEAMNDIAARPDVTSDAVSPAKKPLQITGIKETDKAVIDDAAIERNGRLLARGINDTLRSFSGKDLLPDQVEAASELGVMGFSMLKEFSMPKPVYFAVLISILAIPAIPPLFKLFRPQMQEEKNG